MAILLFTDFGRDDPYVGQMEAAIERTAPGARVIHLLHSAPAFKLRASAHLLAALGEHLPSGSIVCGVVDPGVGSERRGMILHAQDSWFVGPDNGLFSVIAARASTPKLWHLPPASPELSASFHGRDVFAPLAAEIAAGRLPEESSGNRDGLDVDFGAGDLCEIIFVDHYGNCHTGIRASGAPRDARLLVKGRELQYARVFSAVPAGTAFWYENSAGLVEIAVNCGNAGKSLGLEIGEPVGWKA